MGKLSAIVGGVFGFLFLNDMLTRTSGDDGWFRHVIVVFSCIDTVVKIS